ncbi:uncharacterized protein LOC134505906 [Candoia aspera]|uniref:uncharacterized protein LOC134505906 n=1 Tax=Candoia aspera TaxID=51853 RepID=UPI002FD81529
MAWTLLLAFFFTWSTGAHSQYTLTQPAAQSSPLGQSAKISCTMSRDSQVGSYSIAWYQQHPGKSPKYLLYDSNSNGRFTGSKDTSANAAYLTIASLQADDEADYYCGGAYGSGSNFSNTEGKYRRPWKTEQMGELCAIVFLHILYTKPRLTCIHSLASSPESQEILNMLGASLLVLLGIWCTGSRSQPTLIQESSVSPSPGQTVKLSCSLSSGQVQSYWQSWHQQKEGGPPRFLYGYYNSATPGSGDLSRFSASKESSQNKWYLTISNVQPEDEAAYYCAVWYHPSTLFHSDINSRGTETKTTSAKCGSSF